MKHLYVLLCLLLLVVGGASPGAWLRLGGGGHVQPAAVVSPR